MTRLEQDLSGRACDPDTDPATVEHVLPENPSADWESMFGTEHWERSTYRLGNLTLLEPSLNRRIGNASYSQKCEVYAHESKYNMTQRLVERAPTEWTPALLDSRQRDMATRAVHIWRIDFD